MLTCISRNLRVLLIQAGRLHSEYLDKRLTSSELLLKHDAL